MKFEVDVSGYDIFAGGYSICIANGTGIVKGFKMNQNLISSIQNNWKKGMYRYKYTKGRKGILKVRIYSAIIHYLFNAIDKEYKDIELIICRDFATHENNIKQNLIYFLERLQGRKINLLKFGKLANNSNAHSYAYLMNKDKHNLLNCYVNISLKDIEFYLRKK